MQVTGYRSQATGQVTGHRPQVRSLATGQTGNLSADNFKKVLDLDGSTLEPAIRSGDTGHT